jgi:hypothetical protein
VDERSGVEWSVLIDESRVEREVSDKSLSVSRGVTSERFLVETVRNLLLETANISFNGSFTFNVMKFLILM